MRKKEKNKLVLILALIIIVIVLGLAIYKFYPRLFKTGYVTNDFTDTGELNQTAYGCGDLTTENAVYTLNQSLEVNGDCFSIEASNITLNLNGFNISGLGNSSSVGVITSYLTNSSVIKNGLITQFGNATASGFGIYLSSTLDTIENITLLNNRIGILMDISSGNNKLSDIIANYNIQTGVYIQNSNNNILENITANSNPIGIEFNPRANNNTLRNLIVNSNNYGVLFWISSNNTIENLVANNNTARGIDAYDCLNTLIKNSNLSDNGLFDIYLWGNSANTTLLNTSYNLDKESVLSGSELIREWYLNLNVTSSGTSISGADLSVKDRTDALQISTSTDSNGYALGALKEYTRNSSDIVYHSPYTITATKSGYTSYTNSTVNLTTSIYQNIVMTVPSSGNTGGNTGGGGGGGGGSSSTKTYSIGNLTKIYNQDLGVGDIVNLKLFGDHTLKLTQITTSQATFQLNSLPITFSLGVGETKKVDINSDNINDLSISLNSILNNKAGISLLPIEEKIVSIVGSRDNNSTTPIITVETEEKLNVLVWIIGIVVIILAIVLVVIVAFWYKKRRIEKGLSV